MTKNLTSRNTKAATGRSRLCYVVFVPVARSEAYRLRQSLLVRARMPMKLGTKMVEAKTAVTIARYMVFS